MLRRKATRINGLELGLQALEATQSHLKATPKPPQSQLIANRLRPESHLKATLKPLQSHPKATPKLPQSDSKATLKPTSQAVSRPKGRGNNLYCQCFDRNENWCPPTVGCHLDPLCS